MKGVHAVWKGGSSVRVELDGAMVHVDAGSGSSRLPPPDLAFVTHVHQDHVEQLADCMAAWGKSLWYASEQSSEFLRLGYGVEIAAVPQMVTRDYPGGLRVELLPAGHLPGAVAVSARGCHGSRMLATGDWCPRPVAGTPPSRFDSARGVDLLCLSVAGRNYSCGGPGLLEVLKAADADGWRRLVLQSDVLGLELQALQALNDGWRAGPLLEWRVCACEEVSRRLHLLGARQPAFTLPEPDTLDSAVEPVLLLVAGSLADSTHSFQGIWERHGRGALLLVRAGSNLPRRDVAPDIMTFRVNTHATQEEQDLLVRNLSPKRVVKYHDGIRQQLVSEDQTSSSVAGTELK